MTKTMSLILFQQLTPYPGYETLIIRLKNKFARFGILWLVSFFKNENYNKGRQSSDVSDVQKYLVKLLESNPGDKFQKCFEW